MPAAITIGATTAVGKKKEEFLKSDHIPPVRRTTAAPVCCGVTLDVSLTSNIVCGGVTADVSLTLNTVSEH